MKRLTRMVALAAVFSMVLTACSTSVSQRPHAPCRLRPWLPDTVRLTGPRHEQEKGKHNDSTDL